MTDQKDDYYQPWLRDPVPPREEPPAAPAARPDEGLAKPQDVPPVGLDLSGYSRPDQPQRPPIIERERVKAGAIGAARAIRRGAEAFAAWTIDVGERADIPARIEALEIPRRSRVAAARSAALTKAAAAATARGTAKAARASGAASRSLWTRMALPEHVARLSEKAGVKIGSAAEKTRSGLGQVARDAREGLGEAATKLRPAAPEEPVPPPSGLEQLLAREAAEAREAELARAPDLPLFASDLPPAAPATPATPAGGAENGAGGAESFAHNAGSESAAASSAASHPSPAKPAPMVPPYRRTTNEGISMPAFSTRTWALGGGALLLLLIFAFWMGGRFGGGMSRGEVETIVSEYITANPEIIPAALEAQRDKEMARAIDAIRPALEKPYAGAWAGNADGDVTLVVFTDYACGFCRASVPDVDRLVREDKRLKVVFRELPIISPQSRDAALMALAAARQGKYDAFHHAMFAAGSLDKSAIAAAAKRAGVVTDGSGDATANEALFQRELDSNLAIATQLQLNATPTWVVGGQILQGQVGYDALRRAVAEARADG
ncbi:DsbA family protein [Sphingopyxis sp. MWB1]|uniref:DsbA family protein n=1 Tax=Sphingopyxis sp. MWB1 TaxID=1537715 RepID=UPI00068A00FE|nr:thioredoxin domain-containing protein [Sphingopyxis sp. MWB1]